jgi:hypothetical protein
MVATPEVAKLYSKRYAVNAYTMSFQVVSHTASYITMQSRTVVLVDVPGSPT